MVPKTTCDPRIHFGRYFSEQRAGFFNAQNCIIIFFPDGIKLLLIDLT